MNQALRRGTAAGSAGPVFVGGVNRSGTSMARQILGSHPDLAMPPSEFEFFKRLSNPVRSRLAAEQVDRLVEDVLRWPKVARWGLDPALVRDYAASGGRSARSVFVAFLRAYAAQSGKPRFGEKTTYYERHLRRFDRWFGEDYSFVHLLRHPVPTFASTRWYGGNEHAIDAGAWARQWNSSVLTAVRATRARQAGYMAVRYEDIVRDPEAETRRMCLVARLPFDERMLAMVDFEQSENSSFALDSAEYRGKIRSNDGFDRAARIPAAQLAVVRSKCRVAARLIGYDVDDESVLLPLDRGWPAVREEWRERVSLTTGSGAQFAVRLPMRLKALSARRHAADSVGDAVAAGERPAP